MTKFLIEYNPYQVNIVFEKNGRLLNEQTKIGAKSGERLQNILVASSNWNGLPEEIATSCDDDEVEITFRGTEYDFEVLKRAFDWYKGWVSFSFVFEEQENKERDFQEEEKKDFGVPESKSLSSFLRMMELFGYNGEDREIFGGKRE